MDISRRLLLGGVAGLAAMPRLLAADSGKPASAEAQAHDEMTSIEGMKMVGDETIAMLLYPGFTALDLVGPQYMFASLMGAKVLLVAKTLEPVTSDTGIAIVPTATFATCPADLTVVFVPGGGPGTVRAMGNAETVAFVADRGGRAKYVTSVCTGSLVLGKAGLLHGKRATSHWAAREVLADLGARPVAERVVADGNVITGAGVTAGLDFALSLVATLRGRAYAEALALQAEYAPAPPFQTGTPETSRPEILAPMKAMFSPLVEQMRSAAKPQP